MEQTTLNAQPREEIGSAASRRARRAGMIPAVVYGHKEGPVSVLLRKEDIQRVVARRTKMVTLAVDGKSDQVLVKEVQFDTFGESVLHVDFERIAMDELIDVECPVELVGTAKGAAAGGVVEHPVTDLQVSCLPADIPEAIKVGISHLAIGDAIHVRDVQAPPGVTILTEPDAILVTIRPPVVVEEEAPVEAEEAAPGEPEVIGRAKGEEEEPAEGAKE